MTATDRFALPLLHAGQAQKEISHNEALTAIDLLLHPSVLSAGIDSPPADPAPGEGWIVGDSPDGDWEDHPQAIASWTGGGWRFVAPREGLAVWLQDAGTVARYAGGAWEVGIVPCDRIMVGGVQVVGERADAIAAPSGGAIVDAEAREAIEMLLDALRTHGLIASPEL